jgi:hypothetical protein
MPLYQFYYLVYDMGEGTVTFVDLPVGNDSSIGAIVRSDWRVVIGSLFLGVVSALLAI